MVEDMVLVMEYKVDDALWDSHVSKYPNIKKIILL